MLLLCLVFILYIASLSYGLSYEDLAKDECFKKIYVCGDHRVSITGGTGRLVTDPYQLGEVCRRHKEFIACIDDASHFCANNFSDLALMTFDNRRSVKMFCTDFEWKKNYFQSAGCINIREQEVKNECRLEEEERIDDRPWWCLIPEPCEAIERVFDCTVQKMEKRCGSIAAEVYRRMHLLKVENQDVVCEFRLQNPRYCRYQRPTRTPHFKVENDLKKRFTRRTGPMKSSPLKSTSNLISNTIIDSFKRLHTVKQLSLKYQDSENALLETLLDINYKIKKLIRDLYLSRESVKESSSNDFSDKTQTSTSYGRIHFIKDTIFKLYELFNDNKEFKLISDDHVEFSWKGLHEFPIDHVSCFWSKSSRSTFKCNLKVMFLKQDTIDSGFYNNLVEAEDVEDMLHTPEFNSSSIDGKEEFKPYYNFKITEPETLVFISMDDINVINRLNQSNIHRSGLQFEDTNRNWNNENMRSDSVLDGINSFVKENKSYKHTFTNTKSSELKIENYQLRKLEEGLHKRFQNLNIVTEVKGSESTEECSEFNEATKKANAQSEN